MPNSRSDDGHSWEINYGNVPQLLNRMAGPLHSSKRQEAAIRN